MLLSLGFTNQLRLCFCFQDNERLVHRIQQVYKYTRQVRKERKFLMDRLDNYGDNWRQGIAQLIQDGGIPHTKPTTKHKVCFAMQHLKNFYQHQEFLCYDL